MNRVAHGQTHSTPASGQDATSALRENIVAAILERLGQGQEQWGREFESSDPRIPTHFVAIPDLLSHDLARGIYEAFPQPQSMRRMTSWHERKFTSKQLSATPLVEACTFAFQDERVVRAVERIVGFRNLLPDARLYAGGISAMQRGDYLHPHIDNSHDSERRLYRRLNLLYYVTPNWAVENGGHLQLWDDDVRYRVTVPSSFNTLVLMETHKRSWHSVDEVRAEGVRCCVSNYYFSVESPEGEGQDYFHITYFSAPPEKPVRRLLAAADGKLRTLLRQAKKRGFARKDYYG
jgi:Rps23 Pro-64 3,4-dihydroxylase Tpa1-like proline 4-hydroxylase